MHLYDLSRKIYTSGCISFRTTIGRRRPRRNASICVRRERSPMTQILIERDIPSAIMNGRDESENKVGSVLAAAGAIQAQNLFMARPPNGSGKIKGKHEVNWSRRATCILVVVSLAPYPAINRERDVYRRPIPIRDYSEERLVHYWSRFRPTHIRTRGIFRFPLPRSGINIEKRRLAGEQRYKWKGSERER